MQPPIAPADAAAVVLDAASEMRLAFIRLPLAALFGTLLAFRPRRRNQGARKVVVIQTQIMLAVVGAVIMLVVGNSLSRAFGIVGAAGLIRYRSTIADPKDAVVMLCALASGLAVGVGLYQLGAVATGFMMLLLWLIEFLEPAARKRFDLRIKTTDVADLRPKAEDVLKGLGLEYELLVEEEDELRYSVSAPVDVRTKDVSDTLRLVGGHHVTVK
ncbi:MAG TPA: MgtC/SapB family protein, partial [Vicinamibacterales bacterium]|nr:MgtC/SapB family protein [Vicinamibacterales bacterium]